MNNGKIEFTGSISAVVTPFEKNGSINEAQFTALVEQLVADGVGGLLIAGSTGEAWALDIPEKLRLFELARSAAGPDTLLVGGTGEIRTDRTIEASAAARDAGIDVVMVMPPYFVNLPQASVITHFRSISEGAAVPIMVYNHPKSSGVNVTEAYLDELSQIDWVVAVKESALDLFQLSRMIRRYDGVLDVLTGESQRQGAFGAMLGSPALMSSIEPQILGKEGASLFDLGRSGRFEEAMALQKKCHQIDEILSVGSFPANLKAAMNLVGRPAGFCRTPVLELTANEFDTVRTVLVDAGVEVVA